MLSNKPLLTPGIGKGTTGDSWKVGGVGTGQGTRKGWRAWRRWEGRPDSLINLAPQGGAPGLQLYHEGAWANCCPLEEASGGKGRQARAQLHLPPGWLALLLHGRAQINSDMIGGRINSGTSVSG